MHLLKYFWAGKELLITGGTGSLGNALIQTIIDNNIQLKGIRIYSRDELKQWQMKQKFEGKLNIPIAYILGDIRDYQRIEEATRGVDIVIHTAALKQVPAAEDNPREYIRTNTYGSENVMMACIANNVSKALLISTDKSVNPLNLYGATKMAAEKLWLSGSVYSGNRNPSLFVVRYGNVIGSRGSIGHLVQNVKKGEKIPVTDPSMTRFWVSLKQISLFAMNTISHAKTGEVYIPNMISCRLDEFLKTLTSTDEKDWEIIGPRPGEKYHECIVNEEESLKLIHMKDYRIITNKKQPGAKLGGITSDQPNGFTKDKLKELLNDT